MNYSKMSDFEINMAVAKAQGYDCSARQHLGEAGFSTVVTGSTGLDYCKRWADAGPIIESNGIGIMPFQKKAAKAWPTSTGLLSNMSVEHENPLRAAMIVFLMMQEKRNE